MLDLTNIEKPTLMIKLNEKTALDVYPASKAIIEGMAKLHEKTVDELYELIALILSHNKQKKKITVAMIAHLDASDTQLIFKEYNRFIGELGKNPN